MSAPAGHLLVLGIGNVLLRDEGVGVHLLHEVERRAASGAVALPRETRLVDGGTAGLGLLPLLAGARAVLLLDATDLRVAPGVVTVLRGDALGAGGGATRPVQRGGMGDLLAAARLAGVLPAAVALVGVQPDDVASGLLLSAAVRSALPVAAAAAIAELERLDLEAADADAPSFAPGLEMGGSAA